jgi:alpha-galactosidase
MPKRYLRNIRESIEMETPELFDKHNAARHLRGRSLLVFLLCSLGLALATVVGCKKSNAPKTAISTSAAKSAVGVKVAPDVVTIETPVAKFALSPRGALTASLKKDGALRSLDGTAPPEGQTVSVAGKENSNLDLDLASAEVKDAVGKLGTLGRQINVVGKIGGTDLEEAVTVEVYDAFPAIAMLSMRIRNAGQSAIALDSVTLQRHSLTAAAPAPSTSAERLWMFQGSSLNWGQDEMFPVPAKFSQENPFGAPVVTKGDLGHVGGGIPVVAFWSQDVGEAIGHIETLPLVLSIPVRTSTDGRVEAAVRVPAKVILKPGEVFSSPRTFLAVYSGDFYEPLAMWSNAIAKEGLGKPANNEENYAVSWCGWGYEFGVTPKQMLDTIPALKLLDIRWATLDDGWFNDYGDWQPRQPIFAGDAVQDMVKKFHEQGIKMQLWWLPLAVEDGHGSYGGRKFVISEVMKEHPDWLVLDQQGKPARMARNLATLCPALPEVQNYYKQLTERFIRDWGFDGHKLDNIYSTPPCYNPKHHHKSPYDSVYAMGDVYKIIFETTRALKPDSVTQSCPCGTPPGLAWLRFMDQAVTADPVGSLQVRRRVKMYKALLGPNAAVYGDHVELTRMNNVFTNKEQDVGQDFASTLGTGGVLGTKFTWPDYGPKFQNVYLSPEKEAHWRKWISLYNEKMLSKGDFKDLYVYGFDVPEAYAIAKGEKMYYAFYAPTPTSASGRQAAAPEKWSGQVELRGLAGKSYRVADYVNHRDLGIVAGPTAKLKVDFTDFLLLEATPAP